MEKALTKVGSLKVGGLWISKKAKAEFSNITEDLTTFSNTVEEKAKWIFNKLKVSFKDSSVVRYATRVKAILLRGKLTGIEGIKTKVLVWVKVTSVAVEGYKSDKVWFTAGVKKSRPKDAYETPQAAVKVEEF
ncbi:hypothetical protein REPUB_Repub01dG0020700 [Reevesia pubescens]